MRTRRLLAAAALLAASALAHAEHFQYDLDLSGTYSLGGTEGCTPPDFDQPACPRNGTLIGFMMMGLGNGLVCLAETRVPSGLAALIIAGTPVLDRKSVV